MSPASYDADRIGTSFNNLSPTFANGHGGAPEFEDHCQGVVSKAKPMPYFYVLHSICPL